MKRTGPALTVVFLLASAAVSGKDPPRHRKAKPAAPKCDVYARPFTVTRGTGKVQLRALRNPGPKAPAPGLGPVAQDEFTPAFELCRGLGPGWKVAPGSFNAAFLTELQASDSRDLKAALAECPVFYRRVDTVCAPCAVGNQNCPCADRDISDWIFCQKP